MTEGGGDDRLSERHSLYPGGQGGTGTIGQPRLLRAAGKARPVSSRGAGKHRRLYCFAGQFLFRHRQCRWPPLYPASRRCARIPETAGPGYAGLWRISRQQAVYQPWQSVGERPGFSVPDRLSDAPADQILGPGRGGGERPRSFRPPGLSAGAASALSCDTFFHRGF